MLRSFPLAKIGSTVKGNTTALGFSDPGALWVDVSSALALLLDLQHLLLPQSRPPLHSPSQDQCPAAHGL